MDTFVALRNESAALGDFPTPLQWVDLGRHGKILVKSDGVSGSVYGGNKIRKLEYLFADARRRGKKTLVLFGDTESHTVSAAALLGARAGFDVRLALFNYRPSVNVSGRLAELRGTGAAIYPCRTFPGAWLKALTLSGGGDAELVPLGCTNPLTTVGYVAAALEYAAQIDGLNLSAPQHIFVALGTGGTVAGLLIGLALVNAGARVTAVRTTPAWLFPAWKLRRLVAATLRLLNLPRDLPPLTLSRLAVDNTQLGRGYRSQSAAAEEAARVLVPHGLVLEPVYTGRAFASLLAAPEDGRVKVFWNTHDQSHQPPPQKLP